MNISNGNSLIMIPLSVDGQWSVVPAPTPPAALHCELWAGQVPGGEVRPHCTAHLGSKQSPLPCHGSGLQAEKLDQLIHVSLLSQIQLCLFEKISPHSIKCRRNHVSRLRIPPLGVLCRHQLDWECDGWKWSGSWGAGPRPVTSYSGIYPDPSALGPRRPGKHLARHSAPAPAWQWRLVGTRNTDNEWHKAPTHSALLVWEHWEYRLIHHSRSCIG